METEFLFEGEAEGTMDLYQMHGFSMKDTEKRIVRNWRSFD